jgi:hypothetical protein
MSNCEKNQHPIEVRKLLQFQNLDSFQCDDINWMEEVFKLLTNTCVLSWMKSNGVENPTKKIHWDFICDESLNLCNILSSVNNIDCALIKSFVGEFPLWGFILRQIRFRLVNFIYDHSCVVFSDFAVVCKSYLWTKRFKILSEDDPKFGRAFKIIDVNGMSDGIHEVAHNMCLLGKMWAKIRIGWRKQFFADGISQQYCDWDNLVAKLFRVAIAQEMELCFDFFVQAASNICTYFEKLHSKIIEKYTIQKSNEIANTIYKQILHSWKYLDASTGTPFDTNYNYFLLDVHNMKELIEYLLNKVGANGNCIKG